MLNLDLITATFIMILPCFSRLAKRWNFDNSVFCKYNVHMIKFEWDAVKAASNIKKHGISFKEAQSVFFDDFAVQFFDQKNSETEDRFLMLGMSNETNLLLICHCERDEGNTVRVISARKATKNERKHYQRGH